MRVTTAVKQFVNSQTLEALKRSISKTIAEASPHIQAVKENQVKILSQKFTNLNDWYMKITGLDKVNLSQEKVTALQDQLLQIQEKRREVGRQLNDIRIKSIELQDEIHKVKRQDDLEKFLDLMKKETEVLKLEKSIAKTFQDYDQAERELFTAFSDSIRDSHEKQRAQMEYTKYFGIVLSITGSFLAFVYSTIKKEQLKKIIDDRLETLTIPVNNDSSNVLLENVQKINETILKNTTTLNDLKKAVNSNRENINNFIMKDSEEIITPSDINDDHSNKSKYLHVFGIVLGVWLIARAFST
ncbi:uncharacterized protein LOC115877094 [Sitophilus oryzae]|uniref:Uncharacterized protein LOC115877094 n=1 Tax=Sitophilus oryzae TaxID=7048 RepID=A0A6J2XCQ8_SITOR|nr:uncharacterized protein LOC115877094 [Sitophilus oryzae]